MLKFKTFVTASALALAVVATTENADAKKGHHHGKADPCKNATIINDKDCMNIYTKLMKPFITEAQHVSGVKGLVTNSHTVMDAVCKNAETRKYMAKNMCQMEQQVMHHHKAILKSIQGEEKKNPDAFDKKVKPAVSALEKDWTTINTAIKNDWKEDGYSE